MSTETTNTEEIATSITTPIEPEAEAEAEAEAITVTTRTPEPPWIYRDGYDQHYKVRYAGFTIDLDEWVAKTNQKAG